VEVRETAKLPLMWRKKEMNTAMANNRICAVLMFLLIAAAGFGQCTSPVGNPLWWWSDPQYSYSGSTLDGTALSNAAASWSSQISARGFSFGPYVDCGLLGIH
jgi:hypothetical protein